VARTTRPIFLAQRVYSGEEAGMKRPPDFSFETAAVSRGLTLVAGVDEVGRGPLSGPVVAAAVRLDPTRAPAGLNDSKALTAARRETLFAALQEVADVAIGMASVEEIDSLNILRASHLAMCRAVAGLATPPDHLLIDGNLLPRDLTISAEAIVKGDARSVSIVAKVTRDRIMVDLAQQHPGYGWDHNAGYPTKDHLEALRNLGVTPHHRRSFKPVHNILCQAISISA
jgi:ribonuclease HII